MTSGRTVAARHEAIAPAASRDPKVAGDHPYYFSWQVDAPIVAAGVASTMVGTILYNNIGPLTKSEIQLDGVSRFDIVATRYSSDRVAKLSDGFLYASAALPFALLADRTVRDNVGKVGVMFTETLLLTTGLTTIIKSTAQRARPYVYDENLPAATILSRNDRAAFLSGHTSASAAGTFFFAHVYADYHPDSPARPYVWAGAVLVPAAVGYMRVRAGRHYPSDVIAGYALGASIGALVPYFHHHAPKMRGLTVSPSRNGFYANLNF